MNYFALPKGLKSELLKRLNYSRLHPILRVGMCIVTVPFLLVSLALLGFFYIALFLRNACSTPADELEAWLNKRKDGVHFAPEAILYLLTIPFIFFLRALIAISSFFLYFIWFFMMISSYIVSLGGIRWQPYLNRANYDKEYSWHFKNSRFLHNFFAAINIALFAIAITVLIISKNSFALYITLAMVCLVYPIFIFAKKDVRCLDTEEDIYMAAVDLLNIGSFFNIRAALALFNKIPDYKDSKDYISKYDEYVSKKTFNGKKLKTIITSALALALVIAVLVVSCFTIVDSLSKVEYLATAGGYAVDGKNMNSTKIKIPDSYNNGPVVRITTEAFYYFSDLEYIYIPASVKSIGDYAFKNCVSLKTIEFGGTESEWARIAKGKDWDMGCGDYEMIFTPADN